MSKRTSSSRIEEQEDILYLWSEMTSSTRHIPETDVLSLMIERTSDYENWNRDISLLGPTHISEHPYMIQCICTFFVV